MRVLNGKDMTKSRGPRTESWGTPQRQVCREERLLLHLTRKQRYVLLQFRILVKYSLYVADDVCKQIVKETVKTVINGVQ